MSEAGRGRRLTVGGSCALALAFSLAFVFVLERQSAASLRADRSQSLVEDSSPSAWSSCVNIDRRVRYTYARVRVSVSLFDDVDDYDDDCGRAWNAPR